MQRLLKFLHTLGAVGMIGALAALIILHTQLPEPAAEASYIQLRSVMGLLAEWLLLPSLALVLVAGLLSMAVGKYFQDAGWAWMKLALGVVMFEGTLFSVQGPMQREAALAEQVLAGTADAALLGASLASEWGSLWVILLVAVANVAIAIWRPRIRRRA
jgi:hypothetical protein